MNPVVIVARILLAFWDQPIPAPHSAIPTTAWELYHEPDSADVMRACPVCDLTTTDPDAQQAQECRPCVESWLAGFGDASCALVTPRHSPAFTICVDY